jgi:hypothetical protein
MQSRLACEYVSTAVQRVRMFEAQTTRRADSLLLASAGSRSETSVAITAITTTSSRIENAR